MALTAWVAGSCRPIDPGGIGTYGFAVRRGDELLVRDGGRVPDLPGRPMDEEVAEAFGLVVLLQWVAGEGDAAFTASAARAGAAAGPLRIECVSKAVATNARGETEAAGGAMLALQQKARELLPPHARVLHMGRTKCAEADALARLAYVEAMQHDARLPLRFAAALATPYQLDEARKAGAAVHAFMGAEEAERATRAARSRRAD